MSKRLAVLSRRFRGDRGGNFGMIAGLCAIPLVFLVGGAVDLAIAQSRQATIQNAADAAALAAAQLYSTNPDPAALETIARQFFIANTGDLFRTKATLVFDGVSWTESHSRELRLHAEYAYDPIFIPETLAGIAGFGSKTADVRSAVLVSDTTVEVALVLDTSGSMGYPPAAGGPRKIDTLRVEATQLVSDFFAAASTGSEKPTQISVVPFAGSVNVGPQYLNEPWMDPEGLSSVHNDDLLWENYRDASGTLLSKRNGDGSFSRASDPRTKLTRQYIYNKARNKSGQQIFPFRGCVETRTGSAGITDVAPDRNKPETLFVPWFAPDERNNRFKYGNSYLKSDVQNDVNKYFDLSLSPFPMAEVGPNANCDSDPILPLESEKDPVTSVIDGLRANGYTNVEEGVSWGWRTLSNREPFTGGRANGDPKNVKAIIVMTDGQNTYESMNNENSSLYGSYGYSATGRIFEETSQPRIHSDSNFTLAMEARTRKVCENAKADGRRPLLNANGQQLVDARGPVMSDGVAIYTIAFDIPANIAPRIKQVLTDCASYKTSDLRQTNLPYASKQKYYYKVDDQAQLRAAFADIMASLTKLRISQ